MSGQPDPKAGFPQRRVGVWGTVLCVILGAALAFLAAALDGATSFGNATLTRFVVVFLVSWPVAALLIYAAVRDIQEKWFTLRNPDREVRSFTDPRAIIWIVVIVILGLLYLIFGDFSLTP